jgi:hypothetical protein
MALGGPVGFGLFGGGRRAREAEARQREQLNEALRLQKEDRERKDAIAKQGLAYEKAKAELAQAQSELDLIDQRRAQIMASPGKPFRDAGLEGNLEKARERLADASAAVQERQGRLQDLMADRDARIRAAIPQRKEGGFLGFGQSAAPSERQLGQAGSDRAGTQRSKEQVAADKAAIVKGETADTPENKEFSRDYRGTERDLRADEREESRERGNIGAAKRALEVGRAEQGPQNEEARNKELFPIDKAAAEQRAKILESQSAMVAAAQEIQARQQEQAALQAQPGYAQAIRGGAATGKGGGMGGGGLLGAIAGKGGGISAGPAGNVPNQVRNVPNQAGNVPTVGQVAGPVLGKIAQMPVNQVAQAARQLIGGAMNGSRGNGSPAIQAPPGSVSPGRPGGAPLPPQRPWQPQSFAGGPLPPQRPDFGQPQSFAGPRQPVSGQPPPAVGMAGQGGPAQVQRMASGGLFPQLVRSYQSQGWSPQEAINIASVQTRGEGAGLGSGGADAAQGGSNGISQWSADRWNRGVNWMRANGYDPRSVEGQTAWTTQELRGPYRHVNPNSVASLVNDYESPRQDLRGGEIARSQRFASSAGAGGPVQTGSYKGQPYTYQTQPASRVSTSQNQTNQEQGTQRKQPAKQQQAQVPPLEAPPDTPVQPIDIKPFAPPPPQLQGPQGMGMQTYGGQGGQPGGRPGGQDIGPPILHSEDQLRGMKPGSLFRAPDGSLRIVPLAEAGANG